MSFNLKSVCRHNKYRGWTIEMGSCGCARFFKGDHVIWAFICKATSNFTVEYGTIYNNLYGPLPNVFANAVCIDTGNGHGYRYNRFEDIDWDWDNHSTLTRLRPKILKLHNYQMDMYWKESP